MRAAASAASATTSIPRSAGDGLSWWPGVRTSRRHRDDTETTPRRHRHAPATRPRPPRPGANTANTLLTHSDRLPRTAQDLPHASPATPNPKITKVRNVSQVVAALVRGKFELNPLTSQYCPLAFWNSAPPVGSRLIGPGAHRTEDSPDQPGRPSRGQCRRSGLILGFAWRTRRQASGDPAASIPR
jgi:hypothetical protein